MANSHGAGPVQVLALFFCRGMRKNMKQAVRARRECVKGLRKGQRNGLGSRRYSLGRHSMELVSMGRFLRYRQCRAVGHPKLKGELAEVGFLYAALALGLIVLKPHGDNSRYDYAVDNGRRFWRVQVKSTSAKVSRNLYVVNVGRHRGNRVVPYRKGEVDFLAVCMVPENRWYIIPQAAIGRRVQVALHVKVGGKLDRFGRFIDAWEVLTS